MRPDVADRVAVEQHLLPLVVERMRDRAGAISTPLGASGSALFRIRAPGLARDHLDERGDVDRRGRWSTPAPRCARIRRGRRSSTRFTNIHSRGLARRARGPSRAAGSRREAHCRAGPARPRPCWRRSPRASGSRCRAGRASAASRGSGRRARRLVGVRVVAGGVDVDGLARDHHRRCRRRARRKQPARVLGGVHDAVHQQVRAVTERCRRAAAASWLSAWMNSTPTARRCRWHVGGIAPGHVHVPSRPRESQRDRPADETGAAEDERARRSRSTRASWTGSTTKHAASRRTGPSGHERFVASTCRRASLPRSAARNSSAARGRCQDDVITTTSSRSDVLDVAGDRAGVADRRPGLGLGHDGKGVPAPGLRP